MEFDGFVGMEEEVIGSRATYSKEEI